MYYSDLSSGEIRHQIGFDNYIVVENDLSRYGLDFAKGKGESRCIH